MEKTAGARRPLHGTAKHQQASVREQLLLYAAEQQFTTAGPTANLAVLRTDLEASRIPTSGQTTAGRVVASVPVNRFRSFLTAQFLALGVRDRCVPMIGAAFVS